AGALDVGLKQERADRVVERDVGGVVLQHLGDHLVVRNRRAQGFGVGLGDGGIVGGVVVAATAVRVRTAGDLAPQVVVPVLRVVVVGLPTIAGHHVLAGEVSLDERRVVDRRQVDVHAQVGLPLVLQELRNRGVQRVVRVVGIAQALGLAAVGVALLQHGLGLRGVELGKRI